MEINKIILPIGGQGTVLNPTPVLTDLVIGTDKYKINENGDAIGDTGNVIKTKDEIEKLKNPGSPILTEEDKRKQKEQTDAANLLAERTNKVEGLLIEGAEIELDDTKFVVNKDGNIEKDGKVFKTKEELKGLLLEAENNAEPNYIGEIQKTTNLVINDDTGAPISYENTLEGLTKYAQDIHSNGRTLGASEYEQHLFSKFPIIKDVIEHLTLKGSLKDFTEQIDYSKVSIGDNEQQHIDIYTKAKIAQGMSTTEVADMINYLKTDKKLKDAAITSLSYLKNVQEQVATSKTAAIKEMQETEAREATEYWDEVHKAIATKNLVLGDKKFALPEIVKVKTSDGKTVTKTLKDFQDYIEKPLNFNISGQIYTMTQHDYDSHIEDTKRTPHNDLFDAYRRFTGYDDIQLIAANVSSNVVKQVIKLKTKASSGGSGVSGSTGKIVLPIK